MRWTVLPRSSPPRAPSPFAKWPSALLAAAAALAIGACSGSTSTPPTPVGSSLLISVSELRFREEIGGVRPSGVFVEVHFDFASKSDSDLVLAQDDLTLIDGAGRPHPYSRPGLQAWFETQPGYELTFSVEVRKGYQTKQWVSVFDVPKGETDGPFSLRFRDQPPAPVLVTPIR